MVFRMLCAVLATLILFSVECSAFVIKQKETSATSKAINIERNEVTTERHTDTIATKPAVDVLGLLSLTTGLRTSEKRDASNEDATLLSLERSVQTSTGADGIGTTVTAEEDQATECKQLPDDQLLFRLSRETSSGSQQASSGYNYTYTYPVNQTCPQTVLDNFNTQKLLRFRSTCPFDEKTHVDYMRYPRTLKYYQCNCRTGITMNGNTATFSSDYVCDHVVYDVPVLRIGGCVDGVYEYYYDVETLPLACVTRILPRYNA
ncbi:uncharacterized protein LOC117116900 isoform X2 [Anneissia japonica]|uniref:uncharacterized protein LOC117116900 isoform X2 n=1 Tax=Anneissia japonica TaxID=1529436 RepID=UPI00142589E5|nr:uncharacterized protein LOC117116900 isoform X2 [Anneissia japonica]